VVGLPLVAVALALLAEIMLLTQAVMVVLDEQQVFQDYLLLTQEAAEEILVVVVHGQMLVQDLAVLVAVVKVGKKTT
jgi:hypothetical protein